MTCAKHPSLLRSSSRGLPPTQEDRGPGFLLLRRPWIFPSRVSSQYIGLSQIVATLVIAYSSITDCVRVRRDSGTIVKIMRRTTTPVSRLIGGGWTTRKVSVG
jgi:hypothetical protein